MTDRRPLVFLETVAEEFGVSPKTIRRLAERLDLMPHFIDRPTKPPKRYFTIEERKALKNGLANGVPIDMMGK